ncbi:MAG TPA: DHA2 family efflux MFS transporter permease subunit [Pseudonocardia sp.]|uniref:DHA2 family efflux MFS transporter permease subunit n=1 Tax=Pseudonocardia sp. TaxID=60912 RepID=UPI002F41305B
MSGVTQDSVPGEVRQSRQARHPELPELPGQAEPADVASADAVPDPAGWVLPVLILVVGMFMSVLDVTIVNVAVPSIQKDFGGSLDDVLWIATGYTLTLGVVVPLSGWLGDRFGLSTIYVTALVGFAVGSAACGLAWNLDVLIFFRVLQAIPGGLLPVAAMSLLYRLVPKQKIGAAMGIFGLGIIFAPAVGPVLGGYLVQYVDWRLVFYLNVPVGLLGALVARVRLPEVARTYAHKFDLAGFVTVACGLSSILLAAEEGESWGWTGYRILMLVVGGLLCLALFVVIELEVEHPLLDLRVFQVRQFTNSIILLVVMQVNLFATVFFVPVFLQQGQGKEAFDAGVLILPQAIVTAVLMPIVGRLYDKIGPRWLSTIGMAICAYGTYLMYGITPDMTRGAIITWTCIRAVGVGLAMMPMMTAGLDAVAPEQHNQASALNNVARQVFGALGLAALSAMASRQEAQLFADRAALRTSAAGPSHPDPHTARGFASIYQQYQHLNLEVLGTSYGNVFLLTAVVTAASVFLATFLRSSDRPAGSAPRLE